MTNEAKKFTVTILGNSYTIVSDEPEENVVHAAALVDSSMNEILKKVGSLDPYKAAVLVALKFATGLANQEALVQTRSKQDLELIASIDRALCMDN